MWAAASDSPRWHVPPVLVFIVIFMVQGSAPSYLPARLNSSMNRSLYCPYVWSSCIRYEALLRTWVMNVTSAINCCYCCYDYHNFTA